MALNPAGNEIDVTVRGNDQVTGPLDNIITRFGDLRHAVGLAGVAVSALAVGGMAKVTSAAASFETVMADVEKVTDAETAKVLKGRFMDLAETIPIAVEELATLGEQAGKFGIEGPEAIGDFVEAIGMLSVATDLEAEELGKRMAKISNVFDLPMENIMDLGNAINFLADNFATDVDEITNTVTRAGDVLVNQLGLSIDQTLGLSAAMNEVYPTARLAASGLRQMGQAIMDPGKVEDIAGAIGLTTDEFRTMREEDPEGLMLMIGEAMVEGGDAAETLRPVLAGAATDFSKLGGQADTYRDAQRKANDEMEDGESLQRELNIRLDTAEAKWQLVKSRIGNVARVTGERFLPAISAALDKVADGIEILADFNEKTDGMAGALLLVGMFAGGAVIAIGALVPVFGAVTAAAAAGTAALGTMAAAFSGLLLPVGLVVLAIAGLAYAWKNNLFDIQGKTRAVFNWISDKIERVVSYVRDTLIEPFLARLSALWEIHFASIREDTADEVEFIRVFITETLATIRRVVTRVLGFIKRFWAEWGDEIMAIVGLWVEGILFVWSTFADAFLTAINVLINIVTGDWEEAWENIHDFFVRLWDRIVEFVGGEAMANFVDAILSIIDGVKQKFEDFAQWLIGNSFFPDLFRDVVSWLRTTAKNAITGAFDFITDAIESVLSGIDLSGVESMINGVIGLANDAIDAINSIPAVPDIPNVPEVNLPGGGSTSTPHQRSVRRRSGGHRLAVMQHGGIATGAIHAIIGEAGPEAVIPLDRLDEFGGPGVVVNIDSIVASSRAEGREAGRGLAAELRSRGFTR